MTSLERIRPGRPARRHPAAVATLSAALAFLGFVPPTARADAGESQAPATAGSPGESAKSWTPPAPATTVNPEYPEAAKAKGIEGTVLCTVAIDAEGRVTAVEIAEGADALLDEAARASLLRWTFAPATEDGHAVASQVTIPVAFRLS